MNKWISVKNEPPAYYQLVIIWGIAIGDDLCESCEGNQEDSDSIMNVYYGYFDEDEIFRCDFKLDRIKGTHWMPLPEKPNE